MVDLNMYLDILRENHELLENIIDIDEPITWIINRIEEMRQDQTTEMGHGPSHMTNWDFLGEMYQEYLRNKETKDSGTRKELGQYYTPHPLVRFMWMMVRDVLEKDNREFALNHDLLNIIDPFMGTGRFLLEALIQMREGVSENPVNNHIGIRSFEKKFRGIEIDPMAKSIAEINMQYQLSKSFQMYLQEEDNNNIQFLRQDSFTINFDDNDLVKNKLNKSFDIVISNPPYGYVKPTKKLKQLIPYAYPKYNFDDNGKIITFDWDNPVIGKIPETERNRGSVKELFAFALGVADQLVKDDGIICFIVPNSLLNLPTFKWMRLYWLNNYTLHYIINFNKIGELESSLFAPEATISTAIIVMQRKYPSKDHKISYLDLSNEMTFKEKYDFFSDIHWKEDAKDRTDILSFTTKQREDIEFHETTKSELLNNPDYEFILRDETITRIEQNTVFLGDFGNFVGGIQTGKDQVFVGKSKQEVLQKVIQWIRLNNLQYEINPEKVKACIKHKNVTNYGISEYEFVYYDKDLEAISPIRSSIRLRNENEQTSLLKLIVGAKSFTVDTSGAICNKNAIGKKNLYFLLNKSEDILYFLAAILNSTLSSYYRERTEIDNYIRFPIKNTDQEDPLVRKMVKLSKTMHSLVLMRISLMTDEITKKGSSELVNINNEINRIYKLLDLMVFALYFDIEISDLENIEPYKILANSFVKAII